jgi:hypothetical protein
MCHPFRPPVGFAPAGGRCRAVKSAAHRLMHMLTQARLASVGLYTGAEVTLEPGKSGGPGDLLLGWRGHRV